MPEADQFQCSISRREYTDPIKSATEVPVRVRNIVRWLKLKTGGVGNPRSECECIVCCVEVRYI